RGAEGQSRRRSACSIRAVPCAGNRRRAGPRPAGAVGRGDGPARAADGGQGIPGPRQMRDVVVARARSGAEKPGGDGQDGVEKMDRDPFDFDANPPAAGEDVERPEGGEDDPALMGPVLEALKTVRDPEI